MIIVLLQRMYCWWKNSELHMILIVFQGVGNNFSGGRHVCVCAGVGGCSFFSYSEGYGACVIWQGDQRLTIRLKCATFMVIVSYEYN